MIFVNTKKTAIFLQDLLTKLGKNACMLTSDLTDAERDGIIDHFREGDISALISTNVLARGIDVPAVDVVINYDVPQVSDESQFIEPDYPNYLHRIGRTGRFGTDGLAITLYNTEDKRRVDEKILVDKIEKEWETKIEELSSFEEFLKIFKEMRPTL
jgi:ATP-dependent RNA helicase DDX19/DBP5